MGRTNRPTGLIKINNSYVIAPSSFDEAPYDVWEPDTGRDIDGLMHGNIVAKKRKWNAAWKGITEAEGKALINAILTARQAASPWFNITVNSMEPTGINATGTIGQEQTYQVYLGDRTYTYSWWVNGHKLMDFSCSFIER